MLLDQNAVFSDAQAVSATASSTHVVDQAAAGDARTGLYAVIQVDEAFSGVTQLTATLETDDKAEFSSAKALISVTVDAETLTKGAVLLKAPVPAGARRYLRVNYTVSGSGSAGKVSAFLTDMVDL